MNTTDINLINEMNTIIKNNNTFWDFKDSKKYHIHGICSYPATMVPMMQSEILKIILKVKPNISNLLDPFMGSGTTLVEGISYNLNVTGIDINPLAFLLSNFKVNLPNIKSLQNDVKILFNNIEKCDKYPLISFKKIDKWYKPEIIDSMSKIRFCIKQISNKDSRNFFWICLAEISRLSNNSRNSTFKLHIKPNMDINNFKYDTIQNFKKIVNNNLNKVSNYYSNVFKYTQNTTSNLLYLGNSLDILSKKIDDSSVDLIITSPPYGDNHTTVTYGQFSILPLRWIELDDINNNINENLINIDNRIDTESLGGKYYKISQIESSSIFNISKTIKLFYNDLIKNDELNKARKFTSFFIDYYYVFKEMSRVLKKDCYMVLTIGNRRISNNEVKFNQIIKEMCSSLNLEFIYEFDRNILNKRIPNKISKLKNNKPVKSITKEYTLILKKK